MNRVLRLVSVVLAVIVFVGATCRRGPVQVTPVETMEIADEVYYHNVSITWDGSHYFTLNGGNDEWSRVNEYDEDGEFVTSYAPGIDGRTMFYNTAEETFYAKAYDTDLYTVDLDEEDYDSEEVGLFEEDQTSVGFTPDGKRAFELEEGTVYVYDLDEREEVESFELERVYNEGGYGQAIAACDKYLYVWGAENGIIVYDQKGRFVTEFTLPREGFWASLSWCNGMLWIAEDADAGDELGEGTWFGYKLKGLH
uniref:WD40 repeat domain-containing protein n=1 Tax=candidate division WOR-3 bacterium TaxID=2052148 RepID=A0A7C4CB09_UNCW3